MRRLPVASCACLLVMVFAQLAAGQSSGAVLSDSFDGQQLASKLAWTVSAGSVTLEAGQMGFGREGKSTVYLDLGPTAWKEPLLVTLRLRQLDAGAGSVLFHVGLEDTDRAKSYALACSPNPGYFATSGFYDGTTVGTKGTALRADDQWQQLVFRFDPAQDRLCLTQDDRIVWQGTNRLQLPRVTRLILASDGTARWRVDDVRIELRRPDPAAAKDPARQALQTVYRNGVPHTDKNGRVLTRYDRDRSFFPIGIWGNPMGEVWGTNYDLKTVVDAGMNTMWPWSRDLEHTLEQAKKYNLQLVHMGEIDPAVLAKVHGHPNLLGNVWHDEPTGGFWGQDMQAKFDAFLAYRQKVHQTAPELPVFVNDVPWITPPATEWWIRWNTSGDLSCHDNYPIKHSGRVDSIDALAPPLALAVHKNQEKKPVWLIVGAFEQPGRGAFPFRFPTPAQLRACVYAGLIHGATGIVYFTWDTYVCRDGNVIGMSPSPKAAYVPNPQKPGYTHPTPATEVQRVQSQSLWAMAAAINQEVRGLTPSLLSPTVAESELSYQVLPELSHSECPIRGLLKPHPEGGYVLLTVNLDATVLNCRFRFSKPLGTVERLFENQAAWSVPPGSKTWEIDYEPFEVHAFRIGPAPRP